MSEEHGYQRSGKKCREKFENLYKYYKKTKEGKAGRQDGKHYRFFRQLEALYGEANNTSASISDAAHLAAAGSYHTNIGNKSASAARNSHKQVSDTSLSLSNYSDAEAEETSSSDESDLRDDREGKATRRKAGWKVKIRDLIDAQMRRLMEKQEAWMEKMMRAMEEKERERAIREDEWRKHDAARVEREHKFWAGERAWIEARDAALMDALHKLTGKEAAAAAEIRSLSENHNDDGSETMTGDIWPECEINRLMQLRAAVEGREEMVWEEIAAKMGCFGHERSAAACKDKWEAVNNYVLKCGKKRKDNSNNNNSSYFQSHAGGAGVYCDTSEQGNSDHQHQNISLNNTNHDHGSSSPNPNGAAAVSISESCFRYFMGDGYGRIID